MLLLQCLHTVRVPPILLYRHYSPDQLISRTRGPITRDLSVHGDPNVNPKWNNMSAISWTSMHTASNRSTALPKLWQSFFLSQMRAKLQTPAMESGDGKFCGCADGDWTRVSSFPGRCANHYTTTPWYQLCQICLSQSSMEESRKCNGCIQPIQLGSLYYGNRNLISTMLQHIAWGWHMATTFGVQCGVIFIVKMLQRTMREQRNRGS